MDTGFLLKMRGAVGLIVALGCLLVLPQMLLAADGGIIAPAGMVDVPYSYTFFAERGHPEPYTWQVSTSTQADILPAGIMARLSENRDLVLYGTPSRVGMYQFTILPISASGTALDETLVTFEVRPTGEMPIILNGAGLRSGMIGTPFSSEPIVRVVGGVVPYRWCVMQGGLPTGLHFTEQGVIQGVPTVSGQFVFSAEVMDARDMRATTSVTLMIQESSNPGTATQTSPPATSEMHVPTLTTTFTPPSSLSLTERLGVLSRLGLMPNTLIQTSEVDPLMQKTSLYYLGNDGRRHPFQHESVYRSWYESSVLQPRSVSRAEIAMIPFGDAITYRPGERVRFESDPTTYAVAEPKRLHRLPDPQGSGWVWQKGIEELEGAYRTAYQVVNETATSANYDPARLRARFSTPNDAFASIGL